MTPVHSLETPLPQKGNIPLDVRVRSLRLEDKPASQPRTSIIPWALCAILLLMTVAFGYRAYRVGSTMPVTSADTRGESTPQVSKPTSAPSAPTAAGEVVLQSKGYVLAAHQVKLGAKLGGTIAKLSERLEEGQFFKAGEPLAWLETDEYEAEYQHAVSARESAKHRYEELEHGNRPQEIQASLNELKEAEANLEQLERDLRRSQQLIGTSALTAKDFEQARFSRDAMKRRVLRLSFVHELMERGARKEKRDAAKADWKAAEADVAKAKWRLDNCTVRTPFDGHLLSKNVEVGSVVSTQTILGEFANLAVKVETASSGISSFLDAYRDMLWGVRWLLVPAILATLSMVIATAISISVRERRIEMAVLKVLGFGPTRILFMVLAEAAFIGLVSGALSAGSAYLYINKVMGGLRLPIAFFPPFRIPLEALWWGPTLGFLTALVGSIFPAWSARSVRVSQVFSKLA